MSIQVEEMVSSLKAELPFLQCDPAAKNTVQLLLNRIDELQAQRAIHDEYAMALNNRSGRIITDLLNIIETGTPNQDAMQKARRIAEKRGAYAQCDY